MWIGVPRFSANLRELSRKDGGHIMTLFVHAADIHLDSPLKGLYQDESAPDAEEIRSAARAAFDKLVDLVLSEGAPLLIIAGDLYDGGWKDFSTGLYFASRMRKLAEEGVRVAVVRGNHDAENRMTKSLVMPENVKIFSSRKPETWILEDLNMALHGQSYPRRDVTENLALDYPEPVPGMLNIGILHCLISGAEGHLPYAPCTSDQLAAKGYDYWALGHVHELAVVRKTPPIVYPGCIQGRHIRETGEKGCALVEREEDGLSVEFVPLDVLRWMAVETDAAGAESVDRVVSIFGDVFEGRIADLDGRLCCARVKITGCCPVHGRLLADPDTVVANIKAMAAEVSGGRAWIEKVEIRTAPEIDLAQLAESDTPQGELLRYMGEIESCENPFELLNADFSSLKAKLAGTDVSVPEDDAAQLLRDARDILLTMLADMESREERS